MFYCPDEHTEPHVSTETPPPPATANTQPLVDAKQEMETQITQPPELSTHSVAAVTEALSPSIKDEQSSSPLPPSAASTTPPAEVVNEDDPKVEDTVDAPVGPSASLSAQESPAKMEEHQSAPVETAAEKEEKEIEDVMKLEKKEQVDSAELEPAAEVAATVNPVNIVKEESAIKVATEVSQPSISEPEPAAPQTQSTALISASEPEPKPTETAEPPLSNGLPLDTEELSEDLAFSDTTPLDKPDTSHSQESTPVVKTAMPAEEEEEELKVEENKEKSENAPPTMVNCPTEESTTMQGRVD